MSVVVYGGNIPKLTKANSVTINDRVVWITNKNETGKTTITYIGYDYLTKIKLGVCIDGREGLISYLEKQDFSRIDKFAKEIGVTK